MSEQPPNQPMTFDSFADWCLNFDSLSTETKRTVEVLLHHSGTSDCHEAEQILSSRTNLRLNLNNISDFDLSPLQTLTNLTTLNLHNNQIINQSSPLQLLRQEQLSITLSTNPIDRQKAVEAIKSAYTALKQEEPEIIFFPSPDAAMTWQSEAEDEPLGASIREQLFPPKKSILEYCLDEELRSQPDREIEWGLVQWDFDPEYSLRGSPIVTPADLADVLSVTQFLVSQSGRVLEAEKQERLRCLNQLAEHCGWLFLFKKVCLVCDRPDGRLPEVGEKVIAYP